MLKYLFKNIISNDYISLKKVLFIFVVLISAPNLFGQTKLHLLHLSDAEASVSALQTAPNFGALVDKFVEEGNNLGVNTLILSSGDNYLPGAFFSAGGDLSMRNVYRNSTGNITHREANGYADILIHNILGVMASAVGNHEFDLGTATFRELMLHNIPNPTTDVRYLGTSFPYLSAILDFSGDANLSSLYTNTIKEYTNYITTNPAAPATRKMAPATIITINGEKYGIVGATTPIVENISSTGGVRAKEPGRRTNDMLALASILQPYINDLRNNHGINKIILLAHMQQLSYERELVKYLSGVDIVIAGGSNSILADNNDRIMSGDSKVDTYPIITNNKDGEPALIINTDGGYKYVGRLLVDFDANGVIIPNSINNAISGAWAADVQNVTNLFGGNYASAFTNPNSRAARIKTITDGLSNVISSKDGNLFGWTNVFLEGRRAAVRTKETNLGNLSADANLWYAKQIDNSVQVSIKNGGGIRAEIGVVKASGTNSYEELPPLANPLANKQAGQISQLDIENSMRFNNDLTIFTATATQLIQILNHGVAATTPTATPGQFAQVGGVKFMYNPSDSVGNKVTDAFIINENNQIIDTLMHQSVIKGNPNRPIRVVTLGFLTTGGDSYPIAGFETLNPLFFSRLNLRQVGTFSGNARFAENGTEQDAFAEYIATLHNTKQKAFNKGVEGRITRVNSFDIVAQPQEIITCEGEGAKLFDFKVNVDLNFYDYYVQWYKDGKEFSIPMKNSSNLVMNDIKFNMSGVYTAKVWTVIKGSDVNQNIEKQDVTTKFLLYVQTKPEFTKEPISVKVKEGDDVDFYFEAHLNPANSNKVNTLNIEWYKGTTKITNNNRISGAKSNILSIKNIQASDYSSEYTVVVTSNCGSVTSSKFSINQLPAITINSEPSSSEVCVNQNATFSINASINDNSTLNYKWYMNGVELNDNADIIGSKTNQISIKATISSKLFCEVISTVNSLTM